MFESFEEKIKILVLIEIMLLQVVNVPNYFRVLVWFESLYIIQLVIWLLCPILGCPQNFVKNEAQRKFRLSLSRTQKIFFEMLGPIISHNILLHIEFSS